MIPPDIHLAAVENAGNLRPGDDDAVSGGEPAAAAAEDPWGARGHSDLPRSNAVYNSKEYWEGRFREEKEYEWLASFSDVWGQLSKCLPPASHDPSILLVGVGNSAFSADLYEKGYTNLTNIDYSKNVINAMKIKYGTSHPKMKWLAMDMTAMDDLPDGSFDVVIDKAAMDALMSGEGDVWNPDVGVVASCRAMCRHVSRVLGETGTFVQVSFAQPHFRKKYLLGLHQTDGGEGSNVGCEFDWNYKVEPLGGENAPGAFHHYIYTMNKG